MPPNSRLPGFGNLAPFQRLEALRDAGLVSPEELRLLAAADLPTGSAGENLCLLLPLGLSLAPNFRINGVDRVVPMVTEEASVVAGASRVAALLRGGLGLEANAGERLLGGQILWRWEGAWGELARLTEALGDDLVARVNLLHPALTRAGGGLRSLTWRAGPETGLAVLDLVAHTGDAMGAHLLDRLALEVGAELAKVLPGAALTGIVSNRPLGAPARARARVAVADLARAGRGGAQIAADVETLCRWAQEDEGRRPTHLKGALNGVFAVLRAFGQDDRAVTAALVAAAQASPGAVLPRWWRDGGDLVGEFSMPLPVGLTGLALDGPPWSILARLAGVERATDLEEVAVAVGLAQNLAALQTLVSEGIVRGHGELHARRGRGQCGR